MSKRNLLLLASAGWIAYMLYDRNRQSKAIKKAQSDIAELQKQLLDAKDRDFTIPPAYTRDPATMFPAALREVFDSSKNATVAPSPTQIITQV